jgi:hypothetical protein
MINFMDVVNTIDQSKMERKLKYNKFKYKLKPIIMKKNILKVALFSAIALMSIESFAINPSAEKLVIQGEEIKTTKKGKRS